AVVVVVVVVVEGVKYDLLRGLHFTPSLLAIYGGHISGRRLRGIKINPIYHESDAACLRNATRKGEGGQFPPESVEPVGEIQFEVYESIPAPASRLQRQHRYEHHDHDSYDSAEAEDRPDDAEQAGQEGTAQTVVRRQVSGKKQYLQRQERMDAVSSMDEDAPDYLEPGLDQLTPVTSGYSSPSTSSRPSPKVDRAESGKSSASSNDYAAPQPLRRQRQLTAVQEQSIVAEEEEEEEVQEDSGNLSSEDVYEEGHSSDNRGLETTSCSVIPDIGEEKCHFVNFTDGKGGRNDELFSSQESNQNIINSFISYRRELSIDKDITSNFSWDENNDKPALLSQTDKSVRCFDKLTMLPLYSDIHNTSPVTSVDHINNNYGTVPDRMLKQNGPLKEVDQYFQFLHKHSDSLSESEQAVEDLNVCIANSEDDPSAVSETHKRQQSTNCSKAADCTVVKEKCNCNGRPTLKCACGRAALQKLLHDKRMVKRFDIGYALDCSIVEWSSAENNNGDKKPNDDANQKHDPKPNQPSGIKMKSILVNTDKAESESQKHNKPKVVTFHEDTVFNEGKKSTYVKEGVTPGFLCALIDSLDDGIDNPVFEDDEEDIKETTFSIVSEECQTSLTDDEKFRKKCSFKHPSAKNRITSSPITLQVEDLNACSYMQSYLKGLQPNQRCDVIRPAGSCESSPSNSKLRAPPVSIEAIAGTVFTDPSFDEIKEADESQFEYYRRRQRRKYLSRYGGDDVGVDEWLKKTKRLKRIKISLIVAAVVTVIVVAIALIIYFVGTPDPSSVGLTDTAVLEERRKANPEDLTAEDISRFSAGVLFRKR
ncbi:hypothetical protein ElyMa_003578600, partial [Elysia marginata]